MERREELLSFSHVHEAIGEPVGKFDHPRKAPLIVFVSFDGTHITHLADGRKGLAAGTGMTRLNLEQMEGLQFPVSITTCMERLGGRTKSHIEKRLVGGGFLPPQSFQTFLDIFTELSPESATRLARFGKARRERIANLSDEVRTNLAQQKEGVGLALKIAGFETRYLLNWELPADGVQRSYLDGLQEIRMREDAMVFHDLSTVPGYDLIQTHMSGSRIFEQDRKRLTITLANKLPLEEQFGCDLIYFNEAVCAFVMVQYKAMEREAKNIAVYRLPDRQLDKEIDRMNHTRDALATVKDEKTVSSYRLNADPFFLKLCRRHVFNPDDGGLFPGHYLPIEYWSRLVVDSRTLGPKGGRSITSENMGRGLSDDGFVGLVSGGWVGSLPTQSLVLSNLIAEVLQSGKAIAFAVDQFGDE